MNAATGDLLRDLVIDTDRDYQPTGASKGPSKSRNTELSVRGASVCLER